MKLRTEQMKTNVILIFLAIFILTTAGCQQKKDAVSKRISGDCEISIIKGQTLELELESNPTTGYLWEVKKISPDGLLERVGDYSYKRQFNLIGGGGLQIFTFNAARKGEAKLEFAYRRPWEDERETAKKFDVKVTVC